MSRTGWKRAERHAAQMIAGKRHPASSGGRVDCESDHIVCQVKERKCLSLAEVTALALEADELGHERGKHGLLVLKHSAGLGHPTPYLVVVTESTWAKMFPAMALPQPVR